ERIAERGVAISEMPFTWEARGRDFPRRNRIVSGLSQGIIVVEAARRSGSLITARFATEQGRQVFAVPGSPLDPRAEGPNDLLQEGASFCTKAQDVIDALAGQALSRFYPDLSEASSLDEPYVALWDELDPADGPAPASAPARLEPDEMPRPAPAAEESGPVRLLKRTPEEISQLILDLLGPAPVSVDELARVAETSAREVRTVLIGLEMEGRLERHGGNLVSLLLPVRNASGRDRAE
ncbi:MAG TPA: DNA-processing protein DprA, partial [Beijerinckia sp.]|nr:DNA-processing protein DprA [Beijerinckia sp.]